MRPLPCPRCGTIPRAAFIRDEGYWIVDCGNCTESSGITEEAAIAEWNEQPYLAKIKQMYMDAEQELAKIKANPFLPIQRIGYHDVEKYYGEEVDDAVDS